MKILITDDERVQRETLSAILTDLGHETVTAGNFGEACVALSGSLFDLVLTDFKMPDGSGLDVAAKVRQLMPETSVFIMTAYADVSSVIEAMRVGVVDYFLKPLNVELLLKKIRLLTEHKNLLAEVTDLRSRLSKSASATLLGESKPIIKVREMIQQVSKTKGTVLITGESGTGKEVVARLIHTSSAEREKNLSQLTVPLFQKILSRVSSLGIKKAPLRELFRIKMGC